MGVFTRKQQPRVFQTVWSTYEPTVFLLYVYFWWLKSETLRFFEFLYNGQQECENRTGCNRAAINELAYPAIMKIMFSLFSGVRLSRVCV